MHPHLPAYCTLVHHVAPHVDLYRHSDLVCHSGSWIMYHNVGQFSVYCITCTRSVVLAHWIMHRDVDQFSVYCITHTRSIVLAHWIMHHNADQFSVYCITCTRSVVLARWIMLHSDVQGPARSPRPGSTKAELSQALATASQGLGPGSRQTKA
jgi:hypothetical protein